MRHWLMLLTMIALLSASFNPAAAVDVVEVDNVHKLPPIGMGFKRTKAAITYPFRHPVKLAYQLTFPVRHPLVAFKEMGVRTSPYHPAFATLGYMAGIVTPVAVFFRGN